MGNVTDRFALPYPYEADGYTMAGFKALADAIDTQLNGQRAALEQGRRRPMFRVVNFTTNSVSFAAGGTAVGTFTEVLSDSTAGWNLATSANTWTVPAGLAGKWWLRAHASAGGSDSGINTASILLQKNGVEPNPRARRKYPWGTVFSANLTTEMKLVVGDTIKLAFSATGTGTARFDDLLLEAYRVSV